MKKIWKFGCLGILGLTFFLIISFLILFKFAFGATTETIEIKQQIGGKLICESEYNADLASWFYDINYVYLTQLGDTINIGSGEYYGREWNKNEQLLKIGEWMVLKTCGKNCAEKLLIGKNNIDKWNIFRISPKEIEKDSLWISKKIFVKQNSLPKKSFIKKINETKIQVEYLYRIGATIEEQETRLITYEIDTETGIPKMTKIELKK